MSGDYRVIGTKDLLKVFLRSLLIQASWSFEMMQSLGFAYSMIPALRKIYPDKKAFEERLLAHASYFNTQPYLSAFILGASVRLEEERAAGRRSDEDISGMKEALMAPLGALGDSLFWAALKPFAAALAVIFILTGSWWAPVLYLIVFNIVHLTIRLGLLLHGYRSGGDFAEFVTRYNLTETARMFKAISLALLGGVVGMMNLWMPELRPGGMPSVALVLGSMAVVFVVIALMRKGASPIMLMIALAAICIAAAFFGVT